MKTENSRYLLAHITARQTVSMADFGLREPFGWQICGLKPAASERAEIELCWPEARFEGAARLRIAVLDTRETHNGIEVRLAKSGRVVGQFEIRWAAQFQIFEVILSGSDTAALLEEGAILRMVEGSKPVWIVTGGHPDTALPDALSPHLLPEIETDKRAEFLARLDSLATVQCFGWQEGCVLDGLRDLAQIPAYSHLKRSLHGHLGAYFRADGHLIYEAYHCKPSDDVLTTIEATLPFATLCQEFPGHPALQLALDYLAARVDSQGTIQEKTHTSTEGSYTVAYPLAVIAKSRGDQKMAQSALHQVRIRHQRLFDGQNLARWRNHHTDGSFEFGNLNWARGVAWQLLGAARTLRELEGWVDIEAAREEFALLSRWALDYQLSSGLWSVFLTEPELLPDTSGSAGIAAALCIGARRGWLGEEFLVVAQLTERALDEFLTPDGFLSGASQPNKGGEELQRAPYRAIYQMGMGLFAQLIAAREAQ